MLRAVLILVCSGVAGPTVAVEVPGFRKSAWFDEQVREQWVSEGVRVVANAEEETEIASSSAAA